MDYNELIADAKTFFNNGDYNTSLELTLKLLKGKPNLEEGLFLAGQNSLALNDANSAARFFSDLVHNYPKGDYYYLLGQAQAMNDDGMNAIANFELALHKNCSKNSKGRIYKIMSMINVEMGRYEDGIRNIENASQFIGLDLELLKNRYLCYAGLEEYRKAIAACNQMKLISPSSYEAYSMSFEILMKLEMYDEAEKELKRANRSIKPLPQLYFEDKVKFILGSKAENNMNNLNNDILYDILGVYSASLDNLYNNNMDYEEAFSLFLRGAQVYLQLKDGKSALRLANYLWDIPSAYKKKESILETRLKTEEELEEAYLYEFFDNLGSLDFDERNEDFQKVQARLTKLDSIPDGNSDKKTDDKEFPDYQLEDNQKEIIWGIELSAYEILIKHAIEQEAEEHESKDKESEKLIKKELEKAELLKNSKNINSCYLGTYSMLRCNKLLNTDNWRKSYEEAITYWRNQRLLNPDDLLALPYEIRCLIDLRRFDEAESKIERLPAQSKTLLEEVLKLEKSDCVD